MENSFSARNYWGELILFGGTAGAAAALIKLLVHHIFVWTGLAQRFYVMLTTYLVHGHYTAKGLGEAVFSELGDMAIGAAFGAVLCFILRHTRPKYRWWLGAGAGFLLWFLTLAAGILAKIIKSQSTTFWSLFAHFLAMIVFGLLVTAAGTYWKPLRERID